MKITISAVFTEKENTADIFISYDVLYETGHIVLNEKSARTHGMIEIPTFQYIIYTTQISIFPAAKKITDFATTYFEIAKQTAFINGQDERATPAVDKYCLFRFVTDKAVKHRSA